MILDVEFEQTGLEAYLEGLKGPASAAQMLALADSEEELEQALEQLEATDTDVTIDDLPAYADHSDMAQRLALEGKLQTLEELYAQFDENDPLGMYLQELAGIPVCGDVNILAMKLAQGDSGAGEMLMNMSLSRVAELSLEYAGKGVLLMDLIQEGSMGLWAAVGGFEGGDFEAFRDKKIRFAMAKALVLQAYAAGLGQKLRQAVEDYRSADQRLLDQLGRNPTLEEIAQALHIPVAEAAVVASVLESARDMQRVKPQQEQPQEEDQAVEDTAYFRQRQRILELLSGLTEQEAKLLTLRYGLEGGKPMSEAEAGLKLGLTAKQTLELEAKALAKLRKQ